MLKPTRWIVAVVAACSVLITGCGGGGGGAEAEGGCTHAAVPPDGPGDVDRYFPVDVGRTWTYSLTDGSNRATQTVTVGDPTTVGGEPVSVFMTTWTDGTGGGTGTDAYAVRPAGVYRVASSDTPPPIEQALPLLLLPFPVQVPNPAQQVACQNLRFVEDGVTYETDIVITFIDAAIHPTWTVAAGTFTNVAFVYRSIDITMRAQGATARAVVYAGDYYAPGVGLIMESNMTTVDGWEVGVEILELTSYGP